MAKTKTKGAANMSNRDLEERVSALEAQLAEIIAANCLLTSKVHKDEPAPVEHEGGDSVGNG